MNFIIPGSLFVEWICFIISILYLQKSVTKFWKTSKYYLGIVVIVECICYYKANHHISNHWLYNLLLIFEALYISYMFYNLLKDYINVKLIILCGSTIIVILYIFETFNHSLLKLHDSTITVMSVIFVFYSYLYYYYLVKDENYINILYYPPFWWVAGTMLFYFGSTACNLGFTKLIIINREARTQIRNIIFDILNLILYGCWSYSFICKQAIAKLKN